MSNVRLRRLTADSAKLQEYVRRHPRVRLVRMDGDPPERYQLEYRINSLRMVNNELQPVQSHVVEITLPLNYPRLPPQCRMLTPVFHPNIAPHAICVGDHWGAGESLESLIIRIGEMLAYQSYNVKSPLNGEAARWVEENKHRVPLDSVSLLPEEDEPVATATGGPSNPRAACDNSQAAAASPPTISPSGSEQHIQVKCPQCAAQYRVAVAILGRSVRCKRCDHVFTCSAGESLGDRQADASS
jgi:predicted Zn finger-like uncharacterized protein